jgi:hypothetical protein
VDLVREEDQGFVAFGKLLLLGVLDVERETILFSLVHL